MNHGDGPSSVPPTTDAERARQRYPGGMSSLDGSLRCHLNENPNRLKSPGSKGIFVLILGLVMIANDAQTLAAEHTQAPTRTTGEKSIENPAHKTETEAPLDYCTVGRCRPRAPHPWRDALAFGGFAIAAGSITRRSRRRKS